MAMEVLVERCAGVDVHQARVRVCVRTPAADGKRKRVEEFASFGTTTPDLLALADWLAAAPGHAGRDGGHRRVLEAGLLRAGGRL